jgi:photosystem II stability/assembly factor-like uncharacterized protein
LKHFLLLSSLFFLIQISAFSQNQWSAIPNAPSCGRIDDITFEDDSTGYIAVFDSIYKTIDYGNTWSYISQIDTIAGIIFARSLEFINDTIGFVGAIIGGGTFGGMYRTIDGGYSWTKMLNMQMVNDDGICGIDSDNDLLIAVGTFAGPAKFYKTTDYGNSWITQDLSAYATGLVDCFIIDSVTYLISGIADSVSQYKATILKTTDGGNTWQRVYLATGPQGSYLWKLYLLQNGKGFGSVQLGSNFICKTNDHGDTWTEHFVSNSSNDYGGIALYNDTLGWVADQYSLDLFETVDGGNTWYPVNTMLAGNRMIFTAPGNMLASGATIYRYNFTTGISEVNQTILKSHQLTVVPIPASNYVTIDAIALNQTYGLIDVFDEKGTLFRNCYKGFFYTGDNLFTINTSSFPAGNYFVRWRNNEKFISTKFVVAH